MSNKKRIILELSDAELTKLHKFYEEFKKIEYLEENHTFEQFLVNVLLKTTDATKNMEQATQDMKNMQDMMKNVNNVEDLLTKFKDVFEDLDPDLFEEQMNNIKNATTKKETKKKPDSDSKKTYKS